MEEEDGGREGVSQAGWTDSGQSHCSSMSQRFLDELPSARHSVTCDHTLSCRGLSFSMCTRGRTGEHGRTDDSLEKTTPSWSPCQVWLLDELTS